MPREPHSSRKSGDNADGGPRCLPRPHAWLSSELDGVWGCAVPMDLAPWCWPLGELEYLAANAFAEELRTGEYPTACKLATPADPEVLA